MIDIPSAQQQISDAIDAHTSWKAHLKSAVLMGNLKAPASQIGRNDVCQFGKWLASIPAELAEVTDIAQVRDLHTAFHNEAGRIAKLVEDGDLDGGAEQLKTGALETTSSQLVRLLTNWKMSLYKVA